MNPVQNKKIEELKKKRQKLETDPTRPKHLLTETGVGYRFIL